MLRCRSPMLGLEAIGFHFPSNRCLIRPSLPMPFKRPNSSLKSPVAGISLRKGLNSRTGSQCSTRLLCTIANSPSSMASILHHQGGVVLLPATNDSHGGVIVDMKDPMDSGTYVSSLRASLKVWSQHGKKGIWIKLPIELANLVQPTVEVLAVQEKSGKFRGSGVWKFPTGVVDPGEDISAGAVREVKEETGIDAEFVEVLAFRQSHKSFFDKSDLFFICMLHPLSFDITKQDSEIEVAEWIPIQKFAAQPFVEKHELLKYIINLGVSKFEKGYAGFSPISIKSAFTDKKSHLYLNTRDLN